MAFPVNPDPPPAVPPAPQRLQDQIDFDIRVDNLVAWYATMLAWFTAFRIYVIAFATEATRIEGAVNTKAGNVNDAVVYVDNRVTYVNGRVAYIDNRVLYVDNQVAHVDATVNVVDTKATVATDAAAAALAYRDKAKEYRDQAEQIVGPTSWANIINRPARLVVSDPERQTRTAAFNAVAGGIYSVDTTAGSIDIQFPAPAANTDAAPIQIYDVTKKFGTNVPRALPGAGHKIDGIAEPFRMDLAGRLYTYVWFPHLSNWSVQA